MLGQRFLSPIHTNKTCLIKPGLTKWKLVTESWTIGFDIGFKQTLIYAYICAKSVVYQNPKAAFMKKTILNDV